VSPLIEETESHHQAHSIMGQNFLGINTVMQHFGVHFTDDELESLATIPFTEKVLTVCSNTHLLFPGARLSLLNVRECAPSAFWPQDWYEKRAFARDELVDCRWYLVRRDVVPRSTRWSYGEQQAYIGENEYVPRACELVYGVILNYLSREERLFKDTSTRCTDTCKGLYVRVGTFQRYGINLNVSYGYECGCHLGLVTARNP